MTGLGWDMALSDFDKHETIKYSDTAKKFFNRYLVRVSMAVKRSPEAYSPNFSYENFYKPLHELAERIVQNIEPKQRRVHRTDNGFFFYFEDLIIAQQFIDDNVDLINEVMRPASDSIALLRSDAKILIRKKPIYGQFTWIVQLRVGIHPTQMFEIIDNLFTRADYAVGGFACAGRDTWTVPVYLKSYDDAIALRLASGSMFKSITEVVLESDI